MFRLIFFTSWTLLHLYVFWRLATIPLINNRVSAWLVAAVGAVLWGIGVVNRYLDDIGLHALEPPVDLFVMHWLGILFMLLVGMLAADLISGFGLLFRTHLATIRTAGLTLGLLLVLTALVQGLRPPVITEYELPLRNLPAEHDGLTAVVISDTHLGILIDADWLQARVEQVNALQPDLVLMVGDIFEGDYPLAGKDDIRTALSRLTPPHGVWAVTGNHELHGGQEVSVRFLESAGIRVLRNEWVKILPGLAVGGIDDGGHGESRDGASARVRRVLNATPPETGAIFLSHRPRMVRHAADEGIGLMLSGHTHGGQIWPFSYLVGMTNDLMYGRYQIDSMTAIVTRGAGTWGPRMRLWAPGEIVRITLRSPAAP
ncbi:metallophosphoesterase [candidate division GN15 bacterium]|nr:metallophosphoesterase [candidate division GN15 bacterium]